MGGVAKGRRRRSGIEATPLIALTAALARPADAEHIIDGTVDVWCAFPSYDRNDHPNYGKLFLMDGRFLVDPQGNKDKGKPIAQVSHPEQQDNKQFGFWIENPGDLNGDGCNLNQGKAWVIDGKTHNILYALNNPKPQGSAGHRARFGSRIGTAGDVNGNGINDIVVGASGNDNPEGWRPTNGGDGCSDDGVIEPGCRAAQGQAFVFEGANGALIRELNIPLTDQDPPGRCPTS